ncbi:type I restriction-modification system subunit M [Paenibacillus sp. Leaf72]|uniref:type I restriction-modification system subunit M n=1 Tax=Paenibacillus sp. Leaf72 TaxID=1736234 RepID=UPI0006FEF159|nr:class I SAM-dependent DNA methyltransferase [Paenibacillus sp. Leaf72]KQO18074.1 type I restriction endonuclease subunit M [Paenibacillus sp. Leaf72]
MAVKKSELYRSLWASCDALRGGMDASQYKDYILTLLFVKYVSDKYKGVVYGDIDVPEGGSFDDMLLLIGNKNIGEGMDVIIAKLAEANNLKGVIDNAHFNDEDKLGKGKEMVDKLSELLGIFRDQMPDFGRNHAEGDDIIGDAYEYLMRNFATESGKSKGQFYTPAEVSRILAKVVGIEHAKAGETTLYDPACGSGSLLVRAAESAPVDVAIYGQEKDGTTAGLARMNLVLHNRATAEIKGGYSTFPDPQFKNPNDDGALRQFDFAVVNPPFSDKNWTHGLKEYGRFDGYGDRPPQKNGDFAWLLHVIKSLKRNGKAAVILPHGVLFRGNAEATIRQSLIDKGLIKGIIGLPTNLFYGTGIPACIIIIDKENADERDGIFMVDASRDFIKDGNKNRLRERDVYKITTVFNQRITLPKYSRFVPNDEIKHKNAYNLNIPRYIDGGVAEDLQSIDGHLNGGIPIADVESLSLYWNTFPNLKDALFQPLRHGFYSLAVDKDSIRDTIYSDLDFSAYADKVENTFESWKDKVDDKLRTVDGTTKPKLLIAEIAEQVLVKYEPVTLIDKYDAYEVLLSYWNEVMSDDVYLLVQEGYKAIRDIEVFTKTSTKKKKDGTEETRTTETGWDGKLVPKGIVIEMFFSAEKKAIDDIEMIIVAAQAELDEIIENAEDGSAINDVLTDKGKLNRTALKVQIEEIRSSIETEEIMALIALLNSTMPKKKEVEAVVRANPLCKNAVTDSGTITAASIKKRISEIRTTAEVSELYADDYEALMSLQEKHTLIDERSAVLKDLKSLLDKKAREQYVKLTDDQCMELLLNLKWYCSILGGVYALYTAVSHRIAERVLELADRYGRTMPELEAEAAELESKVKSHLERMGFVW